MPEIDGGHPLFNNGPLSRRKPEPPVGRFWQDGCVRTRPLTLADLRGQSGLRRSAALALLKAQPATVLEALRIRDVGRKTTARLLAAGLVADPEGAQRRARTVEEMGPR